MGFVFKLFTNNTLLLLRVAGPLLPSPPQAHCYNDFKSLGKKKKNTIIWARQNRSLTSGLFIFGT